MSQVQGLSGTWEPRPPPESNKEGRIVEGEGQRLMDFLTGHLLGQGVDDWFIFLSFLCAGPQSQVG